jgi:hypothetical protein
MKTNLFDEFFLNKGSSLIREWITVHHAALPAEIEGTSGIGIRYSTERLSSGFRYSTKLRLIVREPIAAAEMRFLVFDIWGQHVRTLSMIEVRDLTAGTYDLSATWNVYSENEAIEHYATISYVARVRTASGRVIEANTVPVLLEARKLSAKFSAEDLEPKPPAGAKP